MSSERTGGSHEPTASPASPASPAALPSLTVAALARRLGVAPATLRTWDRRYGLGPSEHAEGSHRRYSQSDVARLTYMRKLIINGTSPAQAAAEAQNFIGDLTSEVNLDSALHARRDFETDSQRVDTLYRAAYALDRRVLEKGIQSAVRDLGVEQAWHCVLVPLLVMVGDDWARTGAGIEIEHLLSESVMRIFRGSMVELKEPRNARPVLIASVGQEQHTLAITVLAAALAERGIEVQFLGGRTPQAALNEMVRRCAPPVIFLWAQLSENADQSIIDQIPSVRPAPRIIIGGPGWQAAQVTHSHMAADLMSACEEITQAIGA